MANPDLSALALTEEVGRVLKGRGGREVSVWAGKERYRLVAK